MWREIQLKIHRFFLRNYFIVGTITLIQLIIYSFLHYQLVYYGRDLNYWKDVLRQLQRTLEQYCGGITFSLLILQFCFLAFIEIVDPVKRIGIRIRRNTKRKCATYLFFHLVADIESIEKRFNLIGNDVVQDGDIASAHVEMQVKIERFIDRLRYVMTEKTVLISELDLIIEEEYGYIKESRFYNPHLILTDVEIMALLGQ